MLSRQWEERGEEESLHLPVLQKVRFHRPAHPALLGLSLSPPSLSFLLPAASGEGAAAAQFNLLGLSGPIYHRQ